MEQNNYPPSPTLQKPMAKRGGHKKPTLERLYSNPTASNLTATKPLKSKLRDLITLDEEDSKVYERPPRLKGVESVKGHSKVVLATNRSSLAVYPQQTGHYELGTHNKTHLNQRSISCRNQRLTQPGDPKVGLSTGALSTLPLEEVTN